MTPLLIFLPVLGLVVLTLLVWVRLYQTRVAEMKAKRVRPQTLTTSAQTAAALPQAAPVVDNFANLFELPVLFYTIVIVLYVTDSVNLIQIALATAFVLGRYVHTAIHITYNKVMHRFLAYLISSVFLWLMWLIFAIHLIGKIF